MTGSEVDDLEKCEPVEQNGDLFEPFNLLGEALPENGPAIPCGLIAKYKFNDIVVIRESGEDSFHIDSSNEIAWPTDNVRFKNQEKDFKEI